MLGKLGSQKIHKGEHYSQKIEINGPQKKNQILNQTFDDGSVFYNFGEKKKLPENFLEDLYNLEMEIEMEHVSMDLVLKLLQLYAVLSSSPLLKVRFSRRTILLFAQFGRYYSFHLCASIHISITPTTGTSTAHL